MSKGLRLPLVRRPDPVLTVDELRFIRTLIDAHIDWTRRVMDKGLVSESVIRNRFYAESSLEKIKQALSS